MLDFIRNEKLKIRWRYIYGPLPMELYALGLVLFIKFVTFLKIEIGIATRLS